MNFMPNLCKSNNRQQRLTKDSDRRPQLSVYGHIESDNRFYHVCNFLTIENDGQIQTKKNQICPTENHGFAANIIKISNIGHILFFSISFSLFNINILLSTAPEIKEKMLEFFFINKI